MVKLPNTSMFLGLISLLFVLFLSSPVLASADTISHAYHESGTLSNGSIVSLNPSHADYVQLANTATTHLLGVVVSSDASLLAINPSSSTVQVAVIGTVPTRVSTLNGSIKTGDQISVSPLDGIGMKAEARLPVIGTAESSLNTNSSSTTSQQVTDKSGKTTTVQAGQINLAIGISNGTTNDSAITINRLQKLFEDITGRVISTARIVISLIVAGIALLALFVLMYASIYGSIISIGRNPLAKFAILRSLYSVLGLAIAIVAIGGLTIFLLLS
jgi:hypothetical protein